MAYLQTPYCKKPLHADDSMYGWLAPWQGVTPQFLKDPIVYKYRCYNDYPRYNACNAPPKYGYGSRQYQEPQKMVEGFDFAHSVNDFTPTHCKIGAQGTMRCFPKTHIVKKVYGYNS